MTLTSSSSSIRVAAVGDLLLTTRNGASVSGRGLEALSDDVRELFTSCDIVLANLECTLPGTDMVATEPRVFTTEAQINNLPNSGINAVTLGNNHAFDAMDNGFEDLTDTLSKQGIKHCGAGLSLADALRPIMFDIKGIRIAIVGVVDESSGMNRFAGNASSGVAPFDKEILCRHIEELRQDADHVIISPHWGDERFRFPNPVHIEQAHALVDAGACMVLGHHPHVIQGMELYKETPIVYSLGNFLANHVYWDNGDFLTWNRFERIGCILLAELDKGGIQSVRQIPIFDDGETIRLENSGWGQGRLDKANQLLANGITSSMYRREAFRVRTLKPILSHLNWSKLSRVRPGHLRKALRLFSQGMK